MFFDAERNNDLIKTMNRQTSWKRRLWAGAGLAAIAASLCAMTSNLAAGADTEPKPKPEKKKTEARKKLTGAELYTIHCNRCHAERYATEFTQAQWKTLMLHMRVRANLPAAQAKAILKYLQEDAGN